MNTRLYDIGRHFLRPFYNLFWPSRVTGEENIPDEGGFILCANHVHMRDPLFLAVRLPKRHFTFLAKAELFKNPLLRLVIGEKGLGAIPISRGHSDLGAIREALKTIANGHGLGIFPQGTRSRDNSPTPMLTGTALIAIRARVPVLPVYIDAPYRRFHRVDVRVGKPIDLSDLDRRFDSATMEEVTHRIERAVWALRSEK